MANETQIQFRTDKARKNLFLKACKAEKRTMSEIFNGAMDDTIAFYEKMKANKKNTRP